MFNIQDLRCTVENAEGSVSLTANDLYVVSIRRRRPLSVKEWLKHIKSCRKSIENDVYHFSLPK